MSDEVWEGPFAIGDEVLVYSGDEQIDRGEVVGEYAPPGDEGPDGEWAYDVRSPSGARYDGWSEMALGETDGAS